jgi:hypothetical protein
MNASHRSKGAAVWALLPICLLGCGRGVQVADEPSHVSIVQLLANPDRYDGKKIQVDGFLCVQFENQAIYLSGEDAEFGMTSNGFWVAFNGTAILRDEAAAHDRKHVFIEGRFNKNERGHLGLWQGAVEGVDRVVELEKRRE